MAGLAVVAAGVEEGHLVQQAVRRRRQVVHGGHEAVLGADVGQRFNVQVAGQLQPPVAAPRPEAAGKPLVGVAHLQVRGVEVPGLAGIKGQRDRIVGEVGLVERLDAHRARYVGAVHHPQEALPFQGVGGRQEQRRHVRPARIGFGRRRGEVGQVACGGGQQAHRHDVALRLHPQPPLARAVAQRAGEAGGVAAFQFRRRERPRLSGGHLSGHRRRAGLPGIVRSGDADPRRIRARVDQPKVAFLPVVAAGVEERHPVRAVVHRRCGVVHGGHEPVGGAHVGERLDVQVARQGEPPVALAGPDAFGQTLARVAALQVPGVQVDRLRGPDGQGDGGGRRPGVVRRFNANLAILSRVVDHPQEALPAGVFGNTQKQPNALRFRGRIGGALARRKRCSEQSQRGEQRCPPMDETRRRSRTCRLVPDHA